MNLNIFDYYNEDSYIGVFQNEDKVVNKCVMTKNFHLSDYKKENLYFSINNIKPHSLRCVKNVISLNWCFADLDFKHDADSVFAKLSADQVYNLILSELDGEIPIPTIAIDSGRGLYLLWKINQSEHMLGESKNALKRWKRIQLELNNRLKEFYADVRISTDCSRLFRVPGSWNKYSNTEVSIIDDTNITYSLFEMDDFLFGNDITDAQQKLIDDINNTLGLNGRTIYYKHDARRYIKKKYRLYCKKKYGKASEKQIALCKKIAEEKGMEIPNITYSFDAMKYIAKHKDCMGNYKVPVSQKRDYTNLYKRRISFIEDMLKNNPDATGNRENILFLYRYYALKLLDDEKLALEYTKKLNKAFLHPLKENEVERATKSANKYWKNNELRLNTETFCNYIGTSEEVYNGYAYKSSEISEFIFTDLSKKKKSISNKTYYAQKCQKEGKTRKSASINERRRKIQNMMSQGYCDVEIRRILEISESTFYRDKKEIMNTLENTLGSNCTSLIKSTVEDIKEKVRSISGAITAKRKAFITYFSQFLCDIFGAVKNSDALVLYVRSTCMKLLQRYGLLGKFGVGVHFSG